MPRNLDYLMPMHGRMMRQRLHEAEHDARKLFTTLRDDDAVPAWTLDKVARGADNLHQVSRYLRFKVSHPVQFGAPDTGSRPPIWQIALAGTTMIAALLGVNAVVALLAQTSPNDPPKKRRRRPVHFVL